MKVTDNKETDSQIDEGVGGKRPGDTGPGRKTDEGMGV